MLGLISFPQRTAARAMPALASRTLAFALIGLLCLSTALVHAQVTATSSSSSGVTTTSNTPSGATTTPSTSSGSNTPSGTMTATGSATPTPSLPPLSVPNSNVVLDKPLPIKGYPPLFAIGTDIQFAWHYDKEPLVPPANITIEAYMTNTPATIVPIGTALPGNTKNFTWTESMQKNLTLSIATANYTLRIFDGASGRFPGAPFAGGILNNYAGFKFGLYIPSKPGSQQNPPLCATCQFDAITNGAMAALPVLSTLVLSVAVTLCSIV